MYSWVFLLYLLWLSCDSHCAFSSGCLFFPHSLQKANDFFFFWGGGFKSNHCFTFDRKKSMPLILLLVLHVCTLLLQGKNSIVIHSLCVCILALQVLLRMRISSMLRGRWTRWGIWRSSTRSCGWRMRRWSALLLTSWRRRPLEAVTRNSNQNTWVNVPAGPLLPLTARHK